MKARTRSLLLLCAGLPMLAQAPGGLSVSKGDLNVTLYGVLDAGVAKVSHTLDFDPYHPAAVNPTVTKPGDKSATGMFNGGVSQSRWGLKGGYDLGEGWKAVFTLEGAINVPDGFVSNAAVGLAQSRANGPVFSADSAISGQLFSRGAFLGVASETYGTLTMGRHTSLMLDVIPSFDALQGAQLFTPIGFSGTYGGGGATDNSRVDSSVKYRVKVGAFNFGLLHKFGGVAGSASARSADQALAGFEWGGFGATVVYQAYTDAFSVANPSGNTDPAAGAVQPLGTITLSAYDTKATMLALRYKLGPVAFKGAWQKLEYTNPSHPDLDKAVTTLFGQVVSGVSVTPYTVTVGGIATATEKDLTVTWLGVAWDVTPKFNVAAGWYNVSQADWSMGTGGSKGSGTQQYHSLLLDYRFTKAFDIYLGYMGSRNDGALAIGYLNPSNACTGLGMRLAF